MNTRQSFDLLQEMTGWGWWSANALTREITLSTFLVNKFSLASSTLSFDAFVERIEPAAREETVTQLRMFLSDARCGDISYPIRTPHGYVTICSRLGRREFDGFRLVKCEGFAQCGEVVPQPLVAQGIRSGLDKVLVGQRRFTQKMLNILNHTFGADEMDDVMQEVFSNFRADILRVYSFNHASQTYSCVHESTVNGISFSLDKDRKEVPIDTTWMTPLLNKQPIFVDEVTEEKIPDAIRHKLDVKSFMAVPLLSKDGVWGYMTIGLFNQKRHWSYLDRETFWTIANIVGICLSLQKSEREAISQNEFLHRLFRNMPLGYFSLGIEQDKNGTVTDYEYLDTNEMFTRMVGISRENLLGKKHSEIGPIFVKKLDLQVLSRVAFQGEVFHTQGQMRHDGRHYNTTIYCPRKGDIVALFSDVTDTVTASEALQQSEQVLKKMYANTPVGIELYDKDGYMIDVNEKEVEIQGVSGKDSLLGRNLFEHPSLPKFAHDLLKQGKDVTFSVDMEGLKANSQYYEVDNYNPQRYLTIKSTVLRNLQGEVENYMLIIIDNTELYEAKARAEESDRLKSAFLANMSHEIRTPLNAIVGFSDILIETEDKEEQQEYIRIIKKNNSHLLNLISDILDVAKIESGIVDVNYSFIVVEEVCRQTIDSLTLQAQAGVELKFISDEQNASVFMESDPKRILQILTNFLSNAIKFTNSGCITLSYQVIGAEVEFSVKDTGIGLAPGDTERIFERFVKVDEFVPGTGLGLAICRNISDKLGGVIGVESTVGVGSRFWLRLPLMQQPLNIL